MKKREMKFEQETYKYFLDYAWKYYKLHWNLARNAETKSVGLIGFVGIILSALLFITKHFYFGDNKLPMQGINTTIILLSISYFFFLVTIILCLLILWGRKIEIIPPPLEDITKYEESTNDASQILKLQSEEIGKKSKSIEKYYDSKVKWLNWAYLSFFVGLIFIVVLGVRTFITIQ